MSTIAIIPRPVRLEKAKGSFRLTAGTVIRASEDVAADAQFLAEALRPATGFPLPVVTGKRGKGGDAEEIRLDIDRKADQPEAYNLEVASDGVEIRGGTAAGVFHGIQTLLQLLPPAVFREAAVPAAWTVPAVRIEDRPRFGWRGMHLDCSRHFMPREFVKKFIDQLARHKMNVFHWHLTDDQGWRLEIKAYPRLTEVGAWRDRTVIGHHNNLPRRFDDTPHGGFYTQDDVREIVAYAARRHVAIVPEIEMPGHSQAVLAAYPELGCTGGPYHTRTVWAISDDVFCAGNDRCLTFLKNVLKEVLALFPGRYIHIGGDECLKNHWKTCPKCQARIKKEGLKDEHELQSWFLRQITRFLSRSGRSVIGWDEILEGGLPPGAAVMSWRGTEGGVRAAQAGHDAVFATQTHTYFDYCQSEDRLREPLAIGGFLPLEKVYAYEPLPDAIADHAAHVLGAQGQLWTEYMETPKAVEYMAFPRLSALAEVLWSPAAGKDYAGFLTRLHTHMERLRIQDVGARPLA